MTTDNSITTTQPTTLAAPQQRATGILPRTVDDVARLASMAHRSGLAKVASPEAAGVIILAGMELGLTPMQALLGMHLIEGRPTLAADTLVALVMRRTDVCEHWRVVESTPERCVIETRRKGRHMVTRAWTTEDAKRAGLLGKSIWQKYPADMLRHRCATALAREVYPDVVLGFYDPEELGGEPVAEAQPVEVVATQTPTPPNGSPAAPSLAALGFEAENARAAERNRNARADEAAERRPSQPPPDVDVEREAIARESAAPAPAEMPAPLVGFYDRVAEIELPGESVAVWMKHKDELKSLGKEVFADAFKALVTRTEKVGKMKNARLWLEKAVKEERARTSTSQTAEAAS